ncbi:protein transport protein Sss1p [[Candida] jaroonii]|uniref:Protein transport protein Sss1p n=1 Tax=[Candida] jaroonii TaxID=467808 RepID=A0ACA9YGL3_9ASCO|nr:protein transport protein Sss1p [[Candida] jaroonii]
MAEGFEKLVEVPTEFFKDGTAFIKRCQKPSKNEYLKIIRAVGIGFIMMGVVGYVVKLLHIPIRYLIV